MAYKFHFIAVFLLMPFSLFAQFNIIDDDKENPETFVVNNPASIKKIVIRRAKAFKQDLPPNAGDIQKEVFLDVSGRLTKLILYEKKDEVISAVYEYFYNYRDYSKIIEKYNHENRLVHKWFYGRNGLLAEEYMYHDDKTIKNAWFYTYNSFQNTIEELKLDYFGHIKRRNHYTYDSFNKLVGFSHNKRSNNLKYRWRINYSQDADTTLRVKLDSYNKVIETWEYYNNSFKKPDSILKFDEAKNLIEKLDLDYNGDAELIGLIRYDKDREFAYGWEKVLSDKKQIESITYYDHLGLDEKYTWQYDDLGRVVDKKVYTYLGTDKDEELAMETTITYNSKGNIANIRERHIILKTNFVYNYEYLKD